MIDKKIRLENISPEVGNENQSDQFVDIENPSPKKNKNPEITPLLASLEEELNSWSELSGEHCIYKVPERLRTAGNESLYNPKVVSIGPIHHEREGLEAMEEYKKRFLKDFLARLKVKFADYAQFMQGREEKLRNSYAYEGVGHLKSDKLTKIFMVDAAFLVELLLRNSLLKAQDDKSCSRVKPLDFKSSSDVKPLDFKSCRIFGRPKMLIDIQRDVILVENQLPMFILEEIFDTFISPEVDVISLVCEFVSSDRDGASKPDLESVQRSNPVHFLDCLRSCYIFECNDAGEVPKPRDRAPVKHPYIHSVSELHEAGLDFKKSESSNLFSIKYEDGLLRLPYMPIGSASEMIYRNLLAFEQCHYLPSERIFTDFFRLMDQLVNTPQDIDLLVENEIIRRTLGESSAAADVFNRISHGLQTCYDQNHFADIYRELKAYYDRPWNRWKATLKHKYFHNPWAIISVVAAAILLILTIIQTVFSIL
ncbi:hypothetical protein CRG98_003938 [Punica granatum]|uniref:Uncharacterized protein n=1 Tax=Punica granatum TaxID=22663 RepID=A0A2I0L4R0_PUNGR|nr:hypothetical protein CRG98_003938 [Punica granatum]